MATKMIKGKPDDSFQTGSVSGDLDFKLGTGIKTEIGRSDEANQKTK